MDPSTLIILLIGGAPIVLAGAFGLARKVGSFEGALRDKVVRELSDEAANLGLSASLLEDGTALRIEGAREVVAMIVDVPFGVAAKCWVRAYPVGMDLSIRLIDEFSKQSLGLRESRVDLEVGDPTFDQTMLVQGDRVALYALLTAEARTRLIGLSGHDGFWLENGELRIELTARSAYWLRRDVRALHRVAKSLQSFEDPPARLLANYREEPNLVIRQHNAHHLFEDFSDSPEAAVLEGLVLEEAERSNSDSVPDWSEYTELMFHSLSLALCRSQEPRLELIGPVLVRSLDWDLPLSAEDRQELIHALGRKGGSAARRILWTQVKRTPDGPARIRAVATLGRCGGLEDVEPLLALPTGVFDGAWRDAIGGAVQAIQSRHGGGKGGSLSVIAEAGSGGGLSVTTGEGALSEVEEE